MSLVNDLLIELDRNREGAAQSEAPSLDGLSPRQAAPVETGSRSRRLPAFLILLVVGCLGFGIARLSASPSAEEEEAFAGLATPTAALPSPGPATNAETLPRVSAPHPAKGMGELRLSGRSQDVAGSLAAPKIFPDPNLRINRPIALRGVRIRQTGSVTRVEIATDRDADYRVESGRGEGIFSVVLSETTLREPLPMLDLFGTAIRSMQTQSEDDAIRLEFTLDSDSRVQSQRVTNSEGTLLIVDFQPAKRSSAQAARTVTTSTSAKSPSSSRPTADTRNQAKRSTPSMKISRSASDRKRSSKDSDRQSAEELVQSARAAKEAGDLESAALLYETARETSPGHHDAVVEGATILSQLGRVDQALTLIGDARRAQPNSPVYLMVHAKILAEEDLQSAITMLDAAELSVEDAPEIQSLAAAYLQKNGQHGSAIERYESILRRYPNRPQAWMGLGISLEARGRATEALDAYRIAIRLGELPGRSRGWISARINVLSEES